MISVPLKPFAMRAEFYENSLPVILVMKLKEVAKQMSCAGHVSAWLFLVTNFFPEDQAAS